MVNYIYDVVFFLNSDILLYFDNKNSKTCPSRVILRNQSFERNCDAKKLKIINRIINGNEK